MLRRSVHIQLFSRVPGSGTACFLAQDSSRLLHRASLTLKIILHLSPIALEPFADHRPMTRELKCMKLIVVLWLSYDIRVSGSKNSRDTARQSRNGTILDVIHCYRRIARKRHVDFKQKISAGVEDHMQSLACGRDRKLCTHCIFSLSGSTPSVSV